jgi:uncharacterized membrane protein YeaQ/YmgE (transglycosylase-associated protein family)
MEPRGLLSYLIIGLIAGWLAGKIAEGRGFGLLGNIVVGIVGAFIGGFLFGIFGLSANEFIGSVVMATIGAIVLLYVVGLVVKRG